MFWAKPKSTTPNRVRPAVEVLESRCVLSVVSGTVLETNLVSDLPGVAKNLDPHLVNPWGISESPTSPFWVSDNGAGISSLYNTAGAPQALAVTIPAPPGAPAGSQGTPTGTVFSPLSSSNPPPTSNAFIITDGKNSAPAVFIFATEDGTIAAWSPKVDPTLKFDGPNGVSTHAVVMVDNSAKPTPDTSAVYKGLAIATDSGGRTLLYAANFRSGQVDVFDTSFKPVSLSAGAFTDTKLPKGYAPFNVQAFGNQIDVTYAKQDADKHDDVAGPSNGFVDVYKLDGSGGRRLISRGPLDSPWGLEIAPQTFGKWAGDLLVGNFGNGRINVFDPATGSSFGTLTDPDGDIIEIDGLWALKAGNGGNGGDANTVYFTAGLAHEQHGLFGSLTPVAPGTPEGPAEAQAVQATLDVFQMSLQQVQQDIAKGVTGDALNQDLQDLRTATLDLLSVEHKFNDEIHAGSIQTPTRSTLDNLVDKTFATVFNLFGLKK
jgi:uncharacterized protein (TIGR03118 family)